MSDTTQEVLRASRQGDTVELPLVSTAATYKRGHLLNIAAAGYGKMAGDTSSERFAGIAGEELTVASGGSNGDQKIEAIQKGVHLFTFTSTLTQADLEKAAYVKDNYRLARVADVSNAVFAGVIKGIKSASQAWVDIEPAIPGLATLANGIS
jgi:hypothetical protein